jgi:transcriptional regulator with XRE-family HTH domain
MDLKRFRTETLRGKDGQPLTQTEFGDTLGITQEQVSRWEKNPDSVSLKVIRTICNTFGVTPDVLFADFQTETIEPLDLGEPLTQYELKQQMLEVYTSNHLKSLKIFAQLSTMGDAYIEKMKAFKELQHIKPIVGFVGRYDTGKSKMINSLCGSEILPTGWAPTTAIPVLLKHAKSRPDWVDADVLILGTKPEFDMPSEAAGYADAVSPDYAELLLDIRYFQPQYKSTIQDKLIESGDYKLLEKYGTYSSPFIADSNLSKVPYLAVVYIDAPILKTCDLLDMPGIPEYATVHELKFIDALNMVNHVVYLSKATKFMDRVDVRILNKLMTRLSIGENSDNNDAPLTGLTIVASQAHMAKDSSSINTSLDRGAKHLWDQLQSFSEAQGKTSNISQQNVRDICAPYTANSKELRERFESIFASALLDHAVPYQLDWYTSYFAEFKREALETLTEEIKIYEVFNEDIDLADSPHTKFLTNQADNIRPFFEWVDQEVQQHQAVVTELFSDWWKMNMNASLIIELIDDNNYTKKEAHELIGFTLSEYIINKLRMFNNVRCDLFYDDCLPILASYQFATEGDGILSPTDIIHIPNETHRLQALASYHELHNLSGWEEVIETVHWHDFKDVDGTSNISLNDVRIKNPTGSVDELSWKEQLAIRVIEFLELRGAHGLYSTAISSSWGDYKNTLARIVSKQEHQRKQNINMYRNDAHSEPDLIKDVIQGLIELRNIIKTIVW